MNLSQKVAFNTVLLVGGRLAIALSGLVGTIVATRYLGVDRFGQLQTAVTFSALFGVLTDAGVWTIAAREIARRPEDEQRILSTASLIGVGLGLFTAVATVGAAFAVYGAEGRSLVRLAIVILAAPALLTGPLGAGSAYLTARQMAIPGAVGGLLAAFGFLIALTVVVAADLGFTGIAVAYAVSALCNAAILILAARRRVSLRPRLDRPLARQLLRWALPQAFVVAITTIYVRVDIVLLSKLGTDRDVALYGVSYRVLEFLLLVPVLMSTTVFPEMARAAAGSERLRVLVQGLFAAVVVVAVPMLCVFIGFAPEVVRVAGGPRFDGAAGVLRLLVIAVAFSFAAGVLFTALVAIDQQGPLARRMLIVLGVNVALNVVLIGPFAARGAALALILSEIASLTLAWRLFERTGQSVRLRLPFRLATAGLICGGVVAGIRTLVDEPADEPVLVLLGGSLAAVVVFAAAAVALRALPVEVTSAITQLRDRRTATPADGTTP